MGGDEPEEKTLSHSFTVFDVNLIVAGLNETNEEDALEDAEKEPGLMICVNDDNEDDAADCLNNVVDGEDDKADMAEMKVTAPGLTVDAEDVTLTLKRKKIDNYKGQIRVFDKDYNEVLAPDAATVELPETVKTDLLTNGSYSFYLEGVENGARQLELTMEVDLNGKTSKFSDVVTVSVFGFSPQGSHTYDVAEAAGSSSSYAAFAGSGLIGMLAAAEPVSAEVSHSEAFDMGNKTFFVTGYFDYKNPLFALINAGPMVGGKADPIMVNYHDKYDIWDANRGRKYYHVKNAQDYDNLIGLINYFRSHRWGSPPINSSFEDLCSSYGLNLFDFMYGLYYISVDPEVTAPLWVGYLLPGVYSLEVRAKDSENAFVSGEYKLNVGIVDIDAMRVSHNVAGEALPDEDEMDPGAFVPLNNDDDDYDDKNTEDKEQKGAIDGESDLLPIKLSMFPFIAGCKYALDIPDHVKVYRNNDRTELVKSGEDINMSPDNSEVELFVEGVEEGSGNIRVNLNEESGGEIGDNADELRVTVFRWLGPSIAILKGTTPVQ